jgi:protein DJ-1
MSRNIRIVPDYQSLDSLPASQTPAQDYFDILILPGGAPGAKTFCSETAVLELITSFHKTEGKWVAAICAATTALVAAVGNEGGEGRKRRVSYDCMECV